MCIMFAPIIKTHFLSYGLAISDDNEDTKILAPAPPPAEDQAELELYYLV